MYSSVPPPTEAADNGNEGLEIVSDWRVEDCSKDLYTDFMWAFVSNLLVGIQLLLTDGDGM